MMSHDRLAALKNLLYEARVCVDFENVADSLDYLSQAESLLDEYLESLSRTAPLIRGPQLKLALS